MKHGTMEEQIAIEEEAQETKTTKYINTFYKTMNNGGIADTAEGQVFIKLGFDRVVAKIQEFMDTETTGTRKRDKNTLLNLCDDPKVLAHIALSCTLTLIVSKHNRPSVTSVAKRITNALYSEYGVALLRENNPKVFKYMDSQYKRASKKRKADLMSKHIDALRSEVDDLTVITSPNTPEMTRVGIQLVECIINSGTNLFEKRTIRNKSGKGVTYVLSMSESGKEVLKVSHSEVISRLIFSPSPMIVAPIPWTDNYSGGLITHRTAIMKMKTPAGFAEIKSNNLTKVYPVLNKLQSTKWRINTRVLDVITTIFNGNMVDPQSPRKLPRLYGSLPTSNIYRPDEIIIKERYGAVDDDGRFADKKQFITWRRDIEAVTIALDGEMGRRLQIISAIGEATRFSEYIELYFSYVLDSRGRVYTQQAIVTPQSSAETKAMLEFAEGEQLTLRGIYWFQIHTANVFGRDKDDFEPRIQWFEDNIELIRRCGTSPFDCIGDWAYADSPFEFLAACFSWVDHEAGLPVYVPIQLDATNSGVQIYSGLLGDLEGAKTVNVVDVGHRADVYQIVANKVNKRLSEGDYPKFFEVKTSDGNYKRQSTHIEAGSITGKITRTIVKPNVMTVPYSVSKRGMSDQLWDILDSARLQEKEWWLGDPWIVNKILTDINHTCIYETIPGARMGQDYLVALASLCNTSGGMRYTTPLFDIPVIQKKPKNVRTRVKTILGSLSINNWIPGSLDKMSQRNGSAPNYIHSIDSTLLLRVIELMSVHIGVIHDCFLSHANYGDELQHQFKESYIEIMKLKPLELIGAQLDPEGTIEIPYIGTLDLDRVRDAKYIIS